MTIALIFCQKLGFSKILYFFHTVNAIAVLLPFCSFLYTYLPKIRIFTDCLFLPKSKGYNLTFLPKISIFQDCLFLPKSIDYNSLAFFPKIWILKFLHFCHTAKAIVLLFCQKSAFSRIVYFCQQAKALALLFLLKIRILKETIFARQEK